ncbi:unnamed protein product [Mycena citricolor]|uniref:F-box domain-containing protein n=1 Tax=Mycena citricolor TaxID=2018698 RepID=A0AAD2H631_9AGAR|nr:unnamed protein product [Mycena citricolor]
MESLPNELFDQIFSFLDELDLRSVSQVNNRLRPIALSHYLACFNVPASILSSSEVSTLSLSISSAFHLILLISHLRPILSLVCFESRTSHGPQLRYRTLARIISQAPPIPDILIYNRQYMFQKTKREAGYLLSRIPSSRDRKLLIFSGHRTLVSIPRTTPAVPWRLLPPPFSAGDSELLRVMLLVVLCIPLVFAYFVTLIVNSVVFARWLYALVRGPPWPAEDRILHDAGPLAFDEWMRVQVLDDDTTLATLANQAAVLALRPLSGVGPEMYGKVLRTMDLSNNLVTLNIFEGCGIWLGDLLEFLSRHTMLESLNIQHNSVLLPPSDEPRKSLSLSSSAIKQLTAPPLYIPHLLPSTPNVFQLRLTLPPAPRRLGRKHSHADTYRTALAHIGGLPIDHDLTLYLALSPTSPTAPWLLDSQPSDAESGAPPAEAHLTHVGTLVLEAVGLKFKAVHVHAMVPWLTRFPALRMISFPFGSVEKIAPEQRAALVAEICAACRGVSGAGDVAFNIPE